HGLTCDGLVEHGEKGYLAAVRDRGLVIVNDGALTEVGGAVSAWAKKSVVSAARRLRDGRLVFGSRLGGVLIAADERQIEQAVDSAHGLPDDQVMGLAEDRNGGVWIAFPTGLARRDVGAAVTVFDR